MVNVIFTRHMRKTKAFDVKARAVIWLTTALRSMIAGKKGRVMEKKFGGPSARYAMEM